MKVTIVLPAYNEAGRLEGAVKEVKRWAERLGYDYEIIIAEDGSTDGTDKIASRLAREDKRVIHLHSDERIGRGRAIANAFKASSGDVLVYLDVDLSTDMRHLKELIDAVAVEGYDIAIGSRLLKESETERPFKRDIASRVYNFLVRVMLGSKLRDHQCGFKAFRRDSVLKILDEVKDRHWFWDTELLVIAQRRGYRIKEIPVRWRQSEESKVRVARDSLYMFTQIVRMWMESGRSKKFMVFSAILSVAIIVLLAIWSGFKFSILMRMNARILIIAVAIYLISFMLRGYRCMYLLSKLGYRLPLQFCVEGVAVSQMVNVMVPARVGDLARVYVFKMKDVPVTSSLSEIAVERVFDLSTVTLIALSSVILMNSYRFISTPLYSLAFLLGIVVLMVILARMENVLGRIMRDAGVIAKKGFALTAITTLSIWILDSLICYLVLLAFGISDPVIVLLAVSLANIAKAVPITPGGIGAYEAVMTAVLSISGVSAGLAFVVALIDHMLKNALTVLMGMVSLTSLNVRLKDII